MTCQSQCNQNKLSRPQNGNNNKTKQTTLPVVPITPPISKRIQFLDESKSLYVNNIELYLDISLELKESNTSTYKKILQKLYKSIK